ncbi:DUF6777 domain-containing protein [Streptomyces broussonetiae]|uniref:DUF6777 domain-containing protein n=1 Tax=Streptomyces broussonetiae TaxID=2686304 RepID=A0A6I6NHI6_9ACTN|nr:DUF6777 domain-containing protein [Streptomyces broussonetiae]QHA08405.1 hypothetical protein GQF42_38680 [Streptomyces broussonetiae]
MRIPTGSIVTACALSAALLLAGCASPGVKEARMGVEIYLQPAASQGPEPFTGSTVTEPAALPPTSSSDPGVPPDPTLPATLAVVPRHEMRALPGGTPGLYSGTAHVAGCDVERQIEYLTANPARADAFAGAAGISATGVPGFLRGMTPVVLRTDTRVTNHAYHHGQATGYQAVLQAGTAVLVDNRGMPRVRCACGNPLGAPVAVRGGLGARGSAWSGYRPSQVVVVTPAPRVVASITIVDVDRHTWIERRIGHDVRHDQVVAAPAWAAAPPQGAPDPTDTAPVDTAPPAPGLPSAPTGAATPAAQAAPGRSSVPAVRTTPAPGPALPQTSPSLVRTLDATAGSGPPASPGPRHGTGPPGPADDSPNDSPPDEPATHVPGG